MAHLAKRARLVNRPPPELKVQRKAALETALGLITSGQFRPYRHEYLMVDRAYELSEGEYERVYQDGLQNAIIKDLPLVGCAKGAVFAGVAKAFGGIPMLPKYRGAYVRMSLAHLFPHWELDYMEAAFEGYPKVLQAYPFLVKEEDWREWLKLQPKNDIEYILNYILEHGSFGGKGSYDWNRLPAPRHVVA